MICATGFNGIAKLLLQVGRDFFEDFQSNDLVSKMIDMAGVKIIFRIWRSIAYIKDSCQVFIMNTEFLQIIQCCIQRPIA